jgi:hypothetical protein
MRRFVGCACAVVLLSSPDAANTSDLRADLTFTRLRGGNYSVWVANADGSAARRIVTRAYGGSLSADGRWLAYSRQDSYKSGRVSLEVVSTSGGKSRLIGAVLGERWSPRAARLAVIDASGLSIVEPASGARRRLVRARNVWQLSFSPDGRAVAYARANGRSGAAYRSDIFVVRLSDRAITRLTHDGHSASPVWGPDWIVYQRLHWAGGLAQQARLWLMHPDGPGKRLFARGAELLWNRFPVFGLDPLAVSDDGRHLLACQAFEFGCARVTFTVPGGRRYGFPRLRPLERKRGATPVDLSRDGARVLLDVGSPHDDRDHGIYVIPFAGGPLRLLVDDAIQAEWRD